MKNFWLITAGAMIPVIVVGLGVLIIKISMPVDIWSHDNRHIEFESYSPDKAYKIGAYNYDEGALGYTATQVSIVKSSKLF